MVSSTLISRFEPVGLLAGRLMLATIFLHEGVAKLGNYAGSAAYARSFGVPEKLLPLAIAVELGCGALIALGFCTRMAAIALAGFCMFTAAVFHTKFSEINQLLHFEKNVAIAGGLLVLAVCGPGRLSIGRLLGR
jgi:putative oxidoreductase